MKFTLSWLQDYLDTNKNADEIAVALTGLGLEVESLHNPAAALNEFIVAKIITADTHPNADKLRLCTVNTGKETLQIVCGASNARSGIYVVLAPVGSTVPLNNMQIKAAKIRGVDSNGMLCSMEELMLADNAEGIIELAATDADLGRKFVDFAALNDPIFEIAITPNRADCLGVYGVARDLAAKGLGTLKSFDARLLELISGYKNNNDDTLNFDLKIHNQDQKLAPVFALKLFKDLDNKSATPDWMQARLKAIGVKPISLLVDITNYMSFSYARPLHVYDAAKIKGDISLRLAKNGEKFLALNGKEYELANTDYVICDESGPIALPGVIGGALSQVTADTTSVILEIADFDPALVTNLGRKYEIITDARYRFERGIDQGFIPDAIKITTGLIKSLAKGTSSNNIISGAIAPKQTIIKLDDDFIEKLGGLNVDKTEQDSILTKLGFQKTASTTNGNDWQIPSWRQDVHGTADLVEEILRVKGYEHIKRTPLPDGTKCNLEIKDQQIYKIRRHMANFGYSEVVSFSFMEQDKAKLFKDITTANIIKNPISSELGYLRPSIIPNLLAAIVKNNARQNSDLALFEIGPVFNGQAQSANLSFVISGKYETRSIHHKERNVDFFDIKADVLFALDLLGINTANLSIERANLPYYHAGKAAVFKLGKNIIAIFGQVHPKILKQYDLKLPVMAAEIMLDNIPFKSKKSSSKGVFVKSDLQGAVRDFAFVIDENIAAGEIMAQVGKIDKELITEVALFDLYQGSNITSGKKSIGFSVKIQPKTANLTDTALNELSNKVINVVTNMGGVLRA